MTISGSADSTRWRGLSCWAFSQSCVVANALSAGGVFLFPLFVPSLKEHYAPTQSELSTIVLAGMMGQYAFAAGWGVLVDRVGPHACSLSASILFFFSYCTFSYLLAHSLGSPSILAALFFIAGCGRVASYFSAIFASRSRTRKSGLATSVPLALSGISPLALSYVAGLDVFQVGSATGLGQGLDVPKFLFWMGIGCGLINAIGAIGLKHVDDPIRREGERELLLEQNEDEQEALMEAQREAMKAGCMVVPKGEPDGSVSALFNDAGFWTYVGIGVVITGTAEMVISNMGSIVMEFPGAGESSAATQIRLSSMAGTLARLCIPPLADVVSPPVEDGCGCEPEAGQRRVSRLVFPAGFLLVLAGGYVYTAMYVTSAGGLWVLSIGTGFAYGGSWAVLPSITAQIWGAKNLGRNYGILSYAPLVGTPMFTYLYAWSSGGSGVDGVSWRTTFVVSALATIGALCGCMLLFRRWSGRL